MRPHSLFKSKIVCVGSYLVGGGGKTPAAIALARELQSAGASVAFATLNYGRKSREIIEVGQSSDVVEEAMLLAEVAPTIVAPSRLQAVEAADDLGMDYVIVDDGLQSAAFKPHTRVLVLDDDSSVGNGFLFPAGPLREPKEALMQRADLVISVGAKIVCDKPIFSAQKEFAPVQEGSFIAFAGLGDYSKFARALSQQRGLHVLQHIEYPDHYRYTNADLDRLCKIATNLSARLITTEKDYVKLGKLSGFKRVSDLVDCLRMRIVFDRDQYCISNFISDH